MEKNDLLKILKTATGINLDTIKDQPKTMFELQQRMMCHVPTQEEKDEYKKNKEEMEQWEFYHWVNGMRMEKFEIGDIVTRDGTDEHIIKDIDYDFMLIGVECIKEPWAEEGNEPWANIGEYESNLIRRYSLIRKSS